MILYDPLPIHEIITTNQKYLVGWHGVSKIEAYKETDGYIWIKISFVDYKKILIPAHKAEIHYD